METLQTKYLKYISVPSNPYNPPLKISLSREQSDVLDFIDNVTTDYTKDFSFFLFFVDIIIDKIDGYTNYNTSMEMLSTFLEDMNNGCQSGIISEFIYHSDCKEFYIEHIDDMETYMEDYERDNGITLTNTTGSPRYTFACWFCFENFCNELQSSMELVSCMEHDKNYHSN